MIALHFAYNSELIAIAKRLKFKWSNSNKFWYKQPATGDRQILEKEFEGVANID